MTLWYLLIPDCLTLFCVSGKIKMLWFAEILEIPWKLWIIQTLLCRKCWEVIKYIYDKTKISQTLQVTWLSNKIMLNVNKKMTTKKPLNPSWGWYREKSGRKSISNHKQTSTILIPKAFEELIQYTPWVWTQDWYLIMKQNQLIGTMLLWLNKNWLF